MIGGLTQQAFAHSFAQGLEGKALLARHTNQRIDELVKAARCAGLNASSSGRTVTRLPRRPTSHMRRIKSW